MVGNPLIADVTLQTGGIVVVTGKGYGATNFIAMDRTGQVLVDRVIQVEGPTDQLVTVYRGVERETDTVVSCVASAPRRCTDVVWADCAAHVGPHLDGGPPAPYLPPEDWE